MIRVTVTANAYFDDDINDDDRRTERLNQITEAIRGIKHVDGVIRSRVESSADYIRAVTR
ncbi:hypothetical protein [Streptomyces formicae]